MTQKMFRIVVAGRLRPQFSKGLDGVTQREDGPNTMLEGTLTDQSHLHGLLDQLRQLGLEIIRFDTVAADELLE